MAGVTDISYYCCLWIMMIGSKISSAQESKIKQVRRNCMMVQIVVENEHEFYDIPLKSILNLLLLQPPKCLQKKKVVCYR